MKFMESYTRWYTTKSDIFDEDGEFGVYRDHHEILFSDLHNLHGFAHHLKNEGWDGIGFVDPMRLIVGIEFGDNEPINISVHGSRRIYLMRDDDVGVRVVTKLQCIRNFFMRYEEHPKPRPQPALVDACNRFVSALQNDGDPFAATNDLVAAKERWICSPRS